MRSVDRVDLSDEPSESQRTALLKLLADDDPAIYETVRKKILSCGSSSLAWLRPHALSNDPALRRRTLEIIAHFDRQSADNRFLAFCLQHGEEFDLEEGALLLAQTRYPAINPEGYTAVLDSYAHELKLRLSFTSETKQSLAVINHYLFEELGFAGNEENYYDPESSYLNRVLDRRKGNPINLCLLYILLARRLRLPIAGIGLPGHFICRYQSSEAEIYLDTFNRGKFLSKADCVHYLQQGNYSVRDDYLAPVSPRRLLLRICGNLHQIYEHLELADEATRLQRYRVALSR
jgi:regulator of sirC expression with transglutaminase-like and TPR domain